MVHRLSVARKMTSFNMACLVRHDADKFIRGFHIEDNAGEDEHILTFGHKGVHAGVADQIELHCSRVEARRLSERRLIAPQHVLSLSIPKYTDALGISGL